ncbi:MAG: hypothetical protein LBD27_07025 [Tannerella sp.]|nr:hypothetical protein [Tannerella sp.]
MVEKRTYIRYPVNDTRRGDAVETRCIASRQSPSQPAPVSVSHHTPPAPSPEGKGEAVGATEEKKQVKTIQDLTGM